MGPSAAADALEDALDHRGVQSFDADRPRQAAAVGLPGWKVKESFFSHMWAPFPALLQYYRGKEVTDLAPIGEPPEPEEESSD